MITWKLVELLCGNSSVTISVHMTLQEFFLEVQLEVEVNSCVYDIAQVLKELPRR